ncbi:MAG: Plug and carboxypeptidase regulatory-like domain-containing protein [Acidobacteriota bacterium]|nr:Plug and carboxypeptidase regulatory-like domain-containing protein [Acidobacteriota bacterium]
MTDSSGAVIASANVQLKDLDKGFVFTSPTDQSGRYVIRQVPPGRYRVTSQAPYFQPQVKDNVEISINENTSLDFVMKVGAQSQTIDVTSEAVQLETQDAATGQLIDRRLINDLPLINRNFSDLAFLAPGVTEVDTQCPGCSANNFISNGSRNSTADFLLDGVTATNFDQNSGILSPTYLPSVDSVEEFSVQTGNFSAEHGFSGGTIVNIVTRSGTNQFHGSTYDFFRNQILDANDWFNNFNGVKRPGLQRNNFGATIGGPIKRNKTFFFFDYDGTRENSFRSATASVPTVAERNGDFGEVCTLNGGTFDNTGLCSNLTGQLYDPYSADSTLSVPIRSQIIPFNNLASYSSPGNAALAGTLFQPVTSPGNLIDPAMNKLMQLFPLPTRATDAVGAPNWFSSGSNRNSDNKIDAKIDYRFSDANLLSTKYSQEWGNSSSFNCFKDKADPCTSGPFNNTAHLVALNDTHTFSPTLILTLAYGYTRNFQFQHGIGGTYPTLNPVTDLGLPAYFNVSGYRQFPAISINGYSAAQAVNGVNIGTNTFSIFRQGSDTHQLIGSISWLRGPHEFKFGGEWRAHRINFTQPGVPGGQAFFDFTSSGHSNGVLADGSADPNPGGDGLASFLMGIGSMSAPGACSPCTYEVPNAVSTQSFQYAGFVQDNYRLSSKLTLNLGLRYELNTPRTERFNRMNSLDPYIVSPLNGGSIAYQDPITGQTVTRSLLGGEIFANRRDRNNYATDWTNLQPRFGFAYQLPRGMVVRGGYGIYFSTPRNGASGTGPWGFRGYDQTTDWIPSYQGAGVLPGARYSNPYPNGGPVLPPGNSKGVLNDIGFSAVGPIKRISKNTPYEQAWSFGFEKQLPWKIVAEANYIGKKGTHLYLGGFREQNLLSAQFDRQFVQTGNTAGIANLATTQVTNPFFGIITDPNSNLSQATIPAYQLLLPFPQFTGFQGDSPPIANSIYHAAQFRMEKAFSSGLQFLVTYVVSHSIDNASQSDDSFSFLGGGLPGGGTIPVQNPYNLRAERAESTFNVPQVLQITYVYALPFGRGRRFGSEWNSVLNAIVGGWQTNGILRFDDGRPVVPFIGVSNPAIPTYGQRPNLDGVLKRSHGPLQNAVAGAANQGNYFADPSVLSVPAPFTLGSAPRTITTVRTPGTRNTEVSLFKQFPLGNEKRYLEYRIEAFNAFNHPHFDLPNLAVGTSTFGQISGLANPQRQVQMALKLYF